MSTAEQSVLPTPTVDRLRPAPSAPLAAPALHSELGRIVRGILTSRTAAVIALAVCALALRLTALSSAYDLFIDEVTYTNLAQSLAHGHGLVLYGQPFLLHPPAAFGLFAAVILLFHLGGGTEAVLLDLRVVDAVMGAAVCVAAMLLVERAATRKLGLVVGILLAIDPLAISYDSRVMLEAPAQLATVTAFLFVVVADRRPCGSWARWSWLIASGLAAGTALCTKETFGLVVLGACGAMIATGWVLPRRQALLLTAVALACYALSVVAIGLSIGFATWWDAKESGILRLVGARQITGFNSPQTHVTFVSRVVADLGTFAVTYLILGAGCVAGLALLWRLRPWRTPPRPMDPRQRVVLLVALWTASAACYLLYATLFGTIEEQMYYILLLPALISLCVFVASATRDRPAWRAVAVGALIVALAVNAVVWFSVHRGHDDEYRTMLAWEAVHIPPTAIVSATDGTSQFLLRRGVIGQWNTLTELRSQHVAYVVLATTLTEDGYGIATPAFEHALDDHALVVFSAHGASDGDLRIYDVRPLTGARG